MNFIPGIVISDTEERLEEACNLWESVGGVVMLRDLYPVKKPNPRTYLGKGQLESLFVPLDHVLFCDMPISPVNRRNLETRLQRRVWDRTEVVLRIFKDRAQTAEGKLQVELAVLMHEKRKLVGAWKHLERQRGALGKTGGPGEMQKELDRRLLDDRILFIRDKVRKIKKQRDTRRRENTVALVGYTNAGKTAALKILTKDSIETSPKLFATLDTRTRAWHLGDGASVLLVDTVGFIKDLPHLLIDAFHATLEEAVYASLVIHLHDASDPNDSIKAGCVRDTLAELGVDMSRVIDVFNKADLVPGYRKIGDEFFVSSVTGEGWDDVKEIVKQYMQIERRKIFVKDVSHLFCQIDSCTPVKDGFLVEATMSQVEWAQLRRKLEELEGFACRA